MSQAPHTIYKEGISLFTSVASNQRSYPESGQMVIVVARETKIYEAVEHPDTYTDFYCYHTALLSVWIVNKIKNIIFLSLF